MNIVRGELFEKLSDNKKIFYCHTHDANKFLNNPVEGEFILITHNSDGMVTDNVRIENGVTYDADVNLIPKNLKRWFAQNVDVKHEKIEPIPIGLENTKWFKHINKEQKIKNIIKTTRKNKNLIYLNLNIKTNPKIRLPIYNMLKNKKYVTVEYGKNGIGFENYLNNLYNHKFMVCPEGNGIDVHQPWESILVGTIPIQKKNNTNLNWRDLPICWVDDWCQLNDESFLNKEYERIKNSKYNIEKLYFEFWERRIKSFL